MGLKGAAMFLNARRWFFGIAVTFAAPWTANAQQVTTTTPFQSLRSSYSENIGTQWSLGGNRWFWNNNNQVAPPFGPSLANSGTRGGFLFAGNGVSGNLGFNFAQGSDRSIVSSAPSVTTMDGQPGSFFSGEVRPFVLGVTPIVGAYPTAPTELATAAAASQQTMLSNIAKGNAARQSDKLRSYLVRAERSEASGDIKKARANYKLAAAIADEPLKSMILSHVQERFSGSRGRTVAK
jgi:hypothetical protein